MRARIYLMGIGVTTLIAAVAFATSGGSIAPRFARFKETPALMTCYQNGTKILSVKTTQLGFEGKGDYYIEYVKEDGTLGQIRFAFDTMCVTEGRNGDAPAT